MIIARLNDRALPLDRGTRYEDPLDKFLRKAGKGSVSGGGTQLGDLGEVASCEVEIELTNASGSDLDLLKLALERLGAPKGSVLLFEDSRESLSIGNLEGMAVYLNGTDLPDSTYQNSDVNHVYDEVNRLLEGIGSVHSHWEGPSETALYMYGSSYKSMKIAIDPFLATYPLCEKARVVQVA